MFYRLKCCFLYSRDKGGIYSLFLCIYFKVKSSEGVAYSLGKPISGSLGRNL